jgi:ribose 1,5-bisphosphate isomerase
MELESTIKKICNLEIQGAETIAISAVTCFRDSMLGLKEDKDLLNKLYNIRKKILSARPTEPCMRNALDYLFYDLNGGEIKPQISKRADKVLEHFRTAQETISDIGSQKIKKGMVVFTHCHSSTVIHVLKKAHSQGKRFEVYNTETRPMWQGRKTAKELSDYGIPVTHFVDSAARVALKESDVMLIGAESITNEGKIINKIGSEMFAEVARALDVPVYSCTDSWKFDVKTVFGFDIQIEKRHEQEVWKDKPKGVKINNFAFEIVRPELLNGVISELGIFNSVVFIEEIKRNYNWMFKSRNLYR